MGSALHLGGRKKKESDNKQGRTAKSILCDAPETWKTDDPLSIPRFLPPSTSLHLNDFQCAICNNIVDRPVTTPCRKLVCAECISTAIRASDGPSCSNIHPITPTTFTPASDVALKVLGGLLLHCTSCSAIVRYGSMRNKVERLKCMVEEHFRQISPQNLSQLPPAAKRHKGDAQDE